MNAMSLKEYARKRDFQKTPEPAAKLSQRGKGRRFVIQKHDASRLHYDFRLELGRTLKSWAVPKGIPFAKGEKHLAVQVEDHPISYIDFEGTIPEDQYGGGTVMVWDHGTFEPLSKAPTKDLKNGKLHFVLNGTKVKGEWYLVRLRDPKQWLLIKAGESMPPVSRKLDDTSALSGKTMKELALGDRVWQSRPAAKSSRLAKRKSSKKSSTAPLPKFVEPMKAKLVDSLPSGNWIYEIKFDGYRALALRGGSEARLLSRNQKDLGGKFPEVMESILALDVRDAIIDGEIVALDEKGRSSFQLLQAFEMGEKRPPLFYYAFDLLRLNGKDLLNLPVEQRKAELEKLLKDPPGVIRYSVSIEDGGEELLKKARELGVEGLVGKRVGSRYEPGKRSGAWIKIKLQQQQEFVIGGYSDPEGSRKYFGAILVGVYEGDKLEFAGKVGTGFNKNVLRDLYSRFQKIRSDNCPFVDLPEKRSGPYGKPMTASELKRCHWVEPKLVCQIKFTEWTRDGRLRQPVFLGLREDKDPKEVVRE
ncbi:MAG TPA: non-homologous end-joining DNA ligase [Chthoniobacterales bacterium]|nr:non-homologous end-joining DNA ligase [Chthoniobacterales bacterium]